MPRKRKIVSAVLVVLIVAIGFGYGQWQVATQSIHFDLRTIGLSIYEAHSRNGRWPFDIDDLDGTEYLRLPYRKALLENRNFVIVWQQDLDPKPDANRDRVLAYDNTSLLSRFGRVWVCRGDLRIEYMAADELRALVNRSGTARSP